MLETYKQKRVFVTGHTGFKGSWLITLLNKLGAEISGYALPPITNPNHYSLLPSICTSILADISNKHKLEGSIHAFQPDIIFHLAAQPLVRASYDNPGETYQTNVIGTLNVLEAAKACGSVKALVMITTDKVYENKEWEKPYTEEDELGGYDMYSSSKACCEILINSFRNSFFNNDQYRESHTVLLASARAGNVIGGGDWSNDRLIPDIVKAAAIGKTVSIRNPQAVRPWQHVLDCLMGYLLLGEKLLQGNVSDAAAWNFAPFANESKQVQEVAAIAKKIWPEINIAFGKPEINYHEAGLLILDNTKAIQQLGWKPVWSTEKAIEKTIEWYKDFYKNKTLITHQQVNEYLAAWN